MYTFQNNRVRLRALRPEDLDNCVRWFNDTEVQRTLVVYAPQSREAEQKWLERAMQPEGDEYSFAVEAIDLPEPTHIGNVGVHHLDWRHRQCEIGIVIGEKQHWGKGYGPAAFALLLEFGFGELNLHRVYLQVYDFNPRGIRAYEKLGFQLEGRRREALYREGAYHDVLEMSILRPDWEALRSHEA